VAQVSCSSALDQFFKNYIAAYDSALSEFPRYYPLDEVSPCIVEALVHNTDSAVLWQPVLREEAGSFSNVEQALEISLQQDIHQFYGRYFSAPLQFTSPWGEGELLQAWNQTDFEYLQQNIIGHLIMKKKLKQEATWFIGLLGDGDKMLTVNNDTGAVWIEVPGEKPSQCIASALSEFINQISPSIVPPIKPLDDADTQWQHPGIWQRLKIMWQDLIKKK
jgi:SecY interacting protein Syd